MDEETKPSGIRKVGVMLFCLAALLTLFGAFHLIENWRGKKKWESYKRELISQGVKLDLAQFIPPPIPPEENFAASPFFAEVLPGPLPTNWNRWPKLLSTLRVHSSSGRRNERRMTDLVAWQQALRVQNGQDTNGITGDRVEAAKEILAAMKIYEPAIQELRAASARHRSRYNVKYDLDNPWGILVPHLGVVKQVCEGLSLKASAELELGDSAAALNDVRLISRLVHSLDQELFLITYIVRIACFQIMVERVGEGLALEKWSDAQLEELQIAMGVNFVEELAMPLAMERAAGVLTADILLKQNKRAELINALAFTDDGRAGNASFGNVLATLVPRGWYRLEQYNYTRLFQRYLLPGFDGTNRVIFPAVSDRNVAELDKILVQGVHPILSHLFLARVLMPAVGKAHHKAAQAQTSAHQAAIACALERYRHKHGGYPKDLAALAPEFMSVVPHDVINGQPMHYKAGKRPVIYSVGWDDKDNGGTPGKTLWDDKGDWVWTYPE